MPKEARMSVKRVSLFRNGANQAVRIPREFELPGTEAVMRKEDGRLVIEPAAPASLIEYLRQMEPVDEEWPEIEDPPPEPVDL
jgi:antitoxin VapB